MFDRRSRPVALRTLLTFAVAASLVVAVGTSSNVVGTAHPAPPVAVQAGW